MAARRSMCEREQVICGFTESLHRGHLRIAVMENNKIISRILRRMQRFLKGRDLITLPPIVQHKRFYS